jgi:uncharacterized protein (TIGR02118 family)
MVKLVYCIGKKPGMSEAEFFQYWEHVHGPIGARIPGLRRLVQSHRIPVPGDAKTADFDGMAELWFDDMAALLTARRSPEWQVSTEDEKNFIDHSRVAYFVTEEHPIEWKSDDRVRGGTEGGAAMAGLADAIRAEIDKAAVLFRSWSEADVTRDRGAGKWVRKEILGHLIDSAANNHQRFVRAQFISPFVGPGYNQQEWVSVHRYRERSWAELVDLWLGLNRHLAVVVESVPAAKLQTPCVIGKEEPMPLEWVMNDYLRHMKHHLEQMDLG